MFDSILTDTIENAKKHCESRCLHPFVPDNNLNIAPLNDEDIEAIQAILDDSSDDDEVAFLSHDSLPRPKKN